MVRGWKRGTRETEEERARELYRSGKLSVFPDEEGMYVIRGRLPAEVGLAAGAGAEEAAAAHSHLEDGTRVSAETSRRICCDTGVSEVRLDAEGHPLDVGRRRRTIPPALRRALELRDQGCRFPGCPVRHFTAGHHLLHWAEGGETKLDGPLAEPGQPHLPRPPGRALLNGANPDGWTASVCRKREGDIPPEVYFPAVAAIGEALGEEMGEPYVPVH